MDIKQVKNHIRDNAASYLNLARKEGYICPICGSGSGKNGTGITTKDGVHFTCWVGCFSNADIIDIIGREYGLTEYNDKLRKAAELFNIPIDGEYSPRKAESERKMNNSLHKENTIIQQEQEAEQDYTLFFLQANKDIEKTDYHRGLSIETLSRFKIGYVESWRHPKTPNAPASPRLIIPTSKESYLARDIRKQIPESQRQYSKNKVGQVCLFNVDALQTSAKPIFVTEGEIDALSIIDVGGEAVALGSTTNCDKLITELENKKPVQPLIIAMDNDEAGEKAYNELANELKRLKIPSHRFKLDKRYKDPNEALESNREAFKVIVEEAVSEVRKEAVSEVRKEYVSNNSAAYYLKEFVNGIGDSANTPCIPTGFKELDTVLDGGLYEGLYIIGAISSLGKTTFALQMADQIAQAGQDVLIFSLEMARTELIAKSISRNTLHEALKDGDTNNAKSTREITSGEKYKDYSGKEKSIIHAAIDKYGSYANHIYITEGMSNIGAEQIREAVKQHSFFTGNKPVVIVDYIQILAPCNERATDKQNIDKAVLELKRISRDCKIPVIGISSFNRANYSVAVTMEAFKESGAIEYSSDVLIGLQLKEAGQKGFDTNEAKKKDPREIELVILKNRNGRTGDKLEYEYYPKFNCFTNEKGENEEESENWSEVESNYK